MARLSGNLLLLRAHLYLEESVNFALDNIFPNYDSIKQKRPRYEFKLALLESMGASSEFLSPYRKLGKMRNKLAHELDYKFGDREIREFLSSFQGVQRENLEQALVSHTPLDGSMLADPNRFRLAIVSLWAAAHALPKHLLGILKESLA